MKVQGIAVVAERDSEQDSHVEVRRLVDGQATGLLTEFYVVRKEPQRGRVWYTAASSRVAICVVPDLAVASLCLRDLASPHAHELPWEDDMMQAHVERERIAAFLEEELPEREPVVGKAIADRVRRGEHWR